MSGIAEKGGDEMIERESRGRKEKMRRGGGETSVTSCFDMVESEVLTACCDKDVS